MSAPISFDNDKQLSGTAVKIYQLDLETKAFTTLKDFTDY